MKTFTLQKNLPERLIIFLISLIFSSMAFIINAQTIFADDTLNINAIKVTLASNGSIGCSNGTSIFQDTSISISTSTNTSVFAQSLYMGGESNGDLHVSYNSYNQAYTNMYGPFSITKIYDASYDLKYNRVWKVDLDTIKYHINNYQNNNYSVPLQISSWPAHGDTGLAGQSYLLAPFVDLNNNGDYEPSLGDYPDIKGDQALYSIYNDNSKDVYYPNYVYNYNKLDVEVHTMLYAYDCPGLEHTVFHNTKIYNKSLNNYTDFYVGNFTDFDLAQYDDDYIGCDTNLNLFYVYNSVNALGVYNPDTLNMWTAGVKILNYNMSKFTYHNNNFAGQGNPQSDTAYYNYLTAYWGDNTPLTYGGYGHGGTQPTSYAFPSHPLDTSGWSQYNEQLPGNDVRGVGSIAPITFGAGQSLEIDYATINSYDTTKNHLENVDVLFQDAQYVQDFYDGLILSSCLFTSTNNLKAQQSKSGIKVYPNPVGDYIQVESDNNGVLSLYNLIGEKVLEVEKRERVVELNISALSSGVYMLVSDNQSYKIIKE